jgi:PAS domain S-box-containing protein
MSERLSIDQEATGLAEQDEGLLARLVQASPAVLYSCKVAEDFGTIAVTENVRRTLGYSPEDFVGDPSFWAVRIHPEDSARVFEEMPNLFREGEQIVDYRFRHADGHYVWLRDQMKLESNDDGQPIRILGCWLVTAREKSFVARVVSASAEKTTTATAGRIYAKQTRTPIV